MEPLLHFSNVPVLSVYSVKQQASKTYFDKPRGLWVSVEGSDDGWSSWCRSEGYGIGRIPHVVGLAADANILRLSRPADLDSFTDEYGVDLGYHKPAIDWQEVARAHQGIIIAPYVWSRRLHDRTSWYYGWDCASGCIWDASAVEGILPKPIPSEAA